MWKKVINKIKKMGIKGVYIRIIMKLFRIEPSFSCAVREIDSKNNIFNSNYNEPFISMKYSKEYWCADPLIFSFGKETYVFVEVYNRKKRKGDIGCSTIIDGKITEPKIIITEDFHLSFPMIFEFDNNFYMIPETEACESICIYKCIDAPYTWERVQQIHIKKRVVDSILVKKTDNEILFLASELDYEDAKMCKYFMYKLRKTDKDIFEIEFVKLFNEKMSMSYMSRNAGYLFGGIHCVQKSTSLVYGYSTLFFHYDKIDETGLVENVIKEIQPKDINIIIDINLKKQGVHTYCQNGEYEVIDIEYYDSPIRRLFR